MRKNKSELLEAWLIPIGCFILGCFAGWLVIGLKQSPTIHLSYSGDTCILVIPDKINVSDDGGFVGSGNIDTLTGTMTLKTFPQYHNFIQIQ